MLLQGDCLVVLKTIADNSIDAVVTDPPYELGFMGKGWDATGIANNPAMWSEVLRVLKPGGHIAAFSGTRTYHRMACAIEDAGFEVRDQLAWVYGQGFPKSLDVSKAIDKAAGAEREVVGLSPHAANRSADMGFHGNVPNEGLRTITAPATDAAHQWEGWGTALKPAWEPICLARKPLSEPTVAANVLRWGTGAINVDATRVDGPVPKPGNVNPTNPSGANGIYGIDKRASRQAEWEPSKLGRWPANLCHDGSQEVLDLFPSPHGAGFAREELGGGGYNGSTGIGMGIGIGRRGSRIGDSGSAARFFYNAKASKADRAGSKHPTVKPVSLMRWLCRMLCPPRGTILDPFAGSGTTVQDELYEGFNAVLIEREAEYIADIERRLSGAPIPPPAGQDGGYTGSSQTKHRPGRTEMVNAIR